ncbi:MAG: hypothetical protein M0038_18995, partial [Pseudomonadota bacterium]|nr:hypothetical protein [Pseudomonadota bacterium]
PLNAGPGEDETAWALVAETPMDMSDSGDTQLTPSAPGLLGSFVGFVLLAPFLHAPLLGTPVLGYGFDRCGTPRGITPAFQFRAAGRLGLRDDLRLMLQRLIETAEKDLILAHACTIETGLGAAREFLHVRAAVALELLQPGLRFIHPALAHCERFGTATLMVIDHALHHVDPL